jgi:hypothetical protein
MNNRKVGDLFTYIRTGEVATYNGGGRYAVTKHLYNEQGTVDCAGLIIKGHEKFRPFIKGEDFGGDAMIDLKDIYEEVIEDIENMTDKEMIDEIMTANKKCKFCNVDLEDICSTITLSPYRTVKLCAECFDHLKHLQEYNPHFDFEIKERVNASKLLNCTVTVKDIDLFKRIVKMLKKCYDIVPDETKKDILECIDFETK